MSRKIDITFQIQKNTLFLLPTLTHLQGSQPPSGQKVFQRRFTPLFHTHPLFQQCTLAQVSFT